MAGGVFQVSRRGAKLAALIQAAGETAAGQVVFPTAAGPDQTDQQGLAEAGADVILSAPVLIAVGETVILLTPPFELY